jgi:hypothetical protein
MEARELLSALDPKPLRKMADQLWTACQAVEDVVKDCEARQKTNEKAEVPYDD